MRAASPLLLALALTACDGGQEWANTRPAEAPRWRELQDVLDAELERRGTPLRRDVGNSRELRDDTGVLPPGIEVDQGPPAIGADARSASAPIPAEEPDSPSSLDPELVEFGNAMADLVMSTPEALKRARGDVAALGAAMEPVIARALQDTERPALERKALIDLGAAVPSAMIAEALCDIAEGGEEAWLRRYAVWALEGHAAAEGADAVVPRLMLRMKYEPDGEALGWGLRTLWSFGYGAALERATARAQSLPDPAGRATLLAALASYEGLDAPPSPKPSDSLVGETWLWISDLSGAHFQLRGVDDARYVLSSLAPWAAEVFGLALTDDDDYVRLHVAQVLERMGPRGASAAPSLGAALLDPNGAVRGAAADALAAVAGDAAAQPLMQRMGASPPPPYEDRVALARALASLPSPPTELLGRLFETSPGNDLKLACAGGLLRAAHLPALDWLLEQLRSSAGDPAGAEATLERWITGPPEHVRGLLQPTSALEAWQSLEAGDAVIHSAGQATDRRRARADAIAQVSAASAPSGSSADR